MTDGRVILILKHWEHKLHLHHPLPNLNQHLSLPHNPLIVSKNWLRLKKSPGAGEEQP